ncbi:MAG: hypothetical protein EBX36_07015, partial [Planctomycetia bacterium]|nr:hypothetical protein [Planctomycetia bacterium]
MRVMSITPRLCPFSPPKAWHLMQPSALEPASARPCSSIATAAWPESAGVATVVWASSASSFANGPATAACHFGIRVCMVAVRSLPPSTSTSWRKAAVSLSPTPSSVGGSRPSSPSS